MKANKSTSPSKQQCITSSFRTVETQRSSNNDNSNILRRHGVDESGLKLIVISLVERLQQDPNLARFFGPFSRFALFVHQRDFLRTILGSNDERLDLQSFVSLRFHHLIVEQGFHEEQYDILTRHILDSFQETLWMVCATTYDEDADVFDDVAQRIHSFRIIFTSGSNSSNNKNKAACNKMKSKISNLFRQQRRRSKTRSNSDPTGIIISF